MRRVTVPVTDAQSRERLKAYRTLAGPGPHKAAHLADVIWPDTKWVRSQGAGAAASRVLKRLGCKWKAQGDERSGWNWGWMLTGL